MPQFCAPPPPNNKLTLAPPLSTASVLFLRFYVLLKFNRMYHVYGMYARFLKILL